MKKYKTIFVSDVHLGTKDSKADFLVDFLKHNECKELYLVGDIIDGWRVKQKKWHWKKSHSNLVSKIFKMSRKGVKVTYVTGNHDEFLRPYVGMFSLGNIDIVNQAEYKSVLGEKYLVVHGDMFDGLTKLAPWLSFLGDNAYDFLLWINTKYNWIRYKLGFDYWSLSKFVKSKVKEAVDFIFKFEINITQYARKRGFHGVICGHIHTPEIKNIRGMYYMNCGDWVESYSALVENYDGTWDIVYWTKKLEEPTVSLDGK